MSNTVFLASRYQFSNDILNVQATLTDTNLLTITEACAVSATTVIPCSFAFANLTMMYLAVDQPCTATFSGSSNPSLSLLAGDVYVWWLGSHITNPFVANCTTLSIVNASGVNQVNVSCRVLAH